MLRSPRRLHLIPIVSLTLSMIPNSAAILASFLLMRPSSSATTAHVPLTAAPVSTTTTRTGISHIPVMTTTHKGSAIHFSADLTQGLMCGSPRSTGSYLSKTIITYTLGDAARNICYPIFIYAAVT